MVATCGGEDGGKDVHADADFVDGFSALYARGPAHEGGDANAAFPEGAFVPAQAPCVAAGIGEVCAVGPVARFARGAVIGLKEDASVVKEVQSFEFVEDFADGVVHDGEHGGHELSRARQVCIAFHVFFWRVQGIVWGVEGDVHEEGSSIVFGFLDVFNGFVAHEIDEVGAVVIHFSAVFPEVVPRLVFRG